jgi:EAL domain-containing protein (putative c-di-GMP-specific phosphodiesterase class I)
MNNQLVNELSEIAERHHVSMELFDFEITETSVDNHDQILQQMLRLQACGSELSLDDFGAGTSNLSRLLKLPIHVVKIDMDVVWSYFRGESSVLPDLVQMFQNADLKIVVEGVETAKMKDALADMGCDYQQGYYFSKPIPREEFLRLMQDWNTKV